MGLDMYLIVKTYGQFDNGVVLTSKNGVKYTGKDIASISIDTGYWRKDNHIHKWFVDNVQDGVDDCRDYYVTKDNLTDLDNLCVQVLENKEKAKELLPTQSGFFFGGQEYDECYFESLEDTREIIKKTLEVAEDINGCIHYNSSW